MLLESITGKATKTKGYEKSPIKRNGQPRTQLASTKKAAPKPKTKKT